MEALREEYPVMPVPPSGEDVSIARGQLLNYKCGLSPQPDARESLLTISSWVGAAHQAKLFFETEGRDGAVLADSQWIEIIKDINTATEEAGLETDSKAYWSLLAGIAALIHYSNTGEKDVDLAGPESIESLSDFLANWQQKIIPIAPAIQDQIS